MMFGPRGKRLFDALWVGLCLFVSLIYLTGEITKSVIAALFGLISALTGMGSSRVAQLSVAISVLAIAVSFGLPGPERWPDLLENGIHSTTAFVSMVRNP